MDRTYQPLSDHTVSANARDCRSCPQYSLHRHSIYFFGRYSMVDSVPAELLELQTRFEIWRANRKYVREPMPDELRSATIEMLRRYPPSLIHRVLKVDPSRLKNKPPTKRSSSRTAGPKKKLTSTRPIRPGGPKPKSRSSARPQVAALPQPAFFKLPAVTALPVDSSPPHP